MLFPCYGDVSSDLCVGEEMLAQQGFVTFVTVVTKYRQTGQLKGGRVPLGSQLGGREGMLPGA